MKKLSNEYVGEIINRPNGITLIALVITIIVLVIIAGVAINMTVGENGIIKSALQAREMQEAAEIKEKLELQQLDASISLGGEEITLDNYLKYLVDQGIIDESDIEDTQDSNAKTILVDDKYIYTVIKNEDGSIELVYEGKAGQLLPKIKDIRITTTITSISVKVEATRVNGGDYKFYIKDVASGEDYKKKETNKTGEYTFIDLEPNKDYKIKVEVSNENGQVEKETRNINTIIDETAPTITISSSNVDSNKFTLNATVEDSESGLQKIEWYYKKSTDEKYTKLEDTFNGETTSTVKTREVSSIEYSEIYNAFARIYDVANNTKDSDVINISLTTPVAQIGNIGYSTLQNAINAVPTNNTETQVTLLADITATSDVKIVSDAKVKLNLNGKTITGRVNNEGTVEITNGTVSNSSIHAAYNYGTMTLSNATIESTNEKYATITNRGTLNVKENTTITGKTKMAIYDAATTNIYGGTIFSTEYNCMESVSGTFNIYGGNIYSEYNFAILLTSSATANINEGNIHSSTRAAIGIYSSSTANIKGGSIYCEGAGSGINVKDTASVIVEGGKIYAEAEGHGIWVASGGNATIKGGTIQCKNEVSQEALDIDAGGIATIQGGTIEHLNGGRAIVCDGTITINGSNALIQNSSSGTTYPTLRIGSGATCTFTKGTIKNNTSGGCCYYNVNDTTINKTDTWKK